MWLLLISFRVFTLLPIASGWYNSAATALSQYGRLGFCGLLTDLWLQDLADCLSSHFRNLADLPFDFELRKANFYSRKVEELSKRYIFFALATALRRLILNR